MYMNTSAVLWDKRHRGKEGMQGRKEKKEETEEKERPRQSKCLREIERWIDRERPTEREKEFRGRRDFSQQSVRKQSELPP